MGLLDGGASALFSEIMSPLYLPATARSTTRAYDNKGDLTTTSAARSCRAMVDQATESMRRDPDYTAADRAVYVLAATLEGELVEGDDVEVHSGPYAGTRWRVATPIDRDPAGSYWRFRGVVA